MQWLPYGSVVFYEKLVLAYSSFCFSRCLLHFMAFRIVNPKYVVAATSFYFWLFILIFIVWFSFLSAPNFERRCVWNKHVNRPHLLLKIWIPKFLTQAETRQGKILLYTKKINGSVIVFLKVVNLKNTRGGGCCEAASHFFLLNDWFHTNKSFFRSKSARTFL